MDDLHTRLQRIVAILQKSNTYLEGERAAEETGFLSFRPEVLAVAVEELVKIRPPPGTSIDLGCGSGGWLLLAAVAGYDSYGIEIHPGLVEEAERNLAEALREGLINPEVKAVIAQGNFYPRSEKEAVLRFRDAHNEHPASMPWEDTIAWSDIPITLADADIVYCWSWPTQSRFLYNWLERAARRDAIFVLPAYLRYTQGEHMNASLKEPNRFLLSKLNPDGEVFIGRRVE